MLCVFILYMSGGIYRLKSPPNDRFFVKLFMAIFTYSQSFCQKSAERKAPKKYFFVFCFDVQPWTRTLTLGLIRQYTTYYTTTTSHGTMLLIILRGLGTFHCIQYWSSWTQSISQNWLPNKWAQFVLLTGDFALLTPNVALLKFMVCVWDFQISI